jgi:hypothetical protein
VSEKEAWFAASLLFERTFEGGSKAPPLFEESIVLVRAPEDHESAALKKAVKVGMAELDLQRGASRGSGVRQRDCRGLRSLFALPQRRGG